MNFLILREWFVGRLYLALKGYLCSHYTLSKFYQITKLLKNHHHHLILEGFVWGQQRGWGPGLTRTISPFTLSPNTLTPQPTTTHHHRAEIFKEKVNIDCPKKHISLIPIPLIIILKYVWKALHFTSRANINTTGIQGYWLQHYQT